MTELKSIRLDFYQIIPKKSKKIEFSELCKSVSKAINSLPDSTNMKPLMRNDNQVDVYDNFQRNSSFIFGAFVKDQMADIPPKHDIRTRVTKPINLGESEGLAYLTCFLFDPSMNILVIEGGTNCISAATFCSFVMNNVDIPGIESAIVLNPIDIQKFMRMNFISSFKVKAAKIENGTLFNTPKDSFKQVIDSADDTNTEYLEYKLTSVKKGNSLAPAKIKKWAQDLITYKDTKEIVELQVTGTETEDEHPLMIDFIKQRMRESISVERQRQIGSFYLKERFDKIDAAFSKHRQALLDIYRIQ